MSDADDRPPGATGPGGDPAAGSDTGSDAGSDAGSHEPVGSVGEEAAKLFGALSDWARDQGVEAAGGVAGRFAQVLEDVDEHVATDSEDCRYCPVCQVVRVVRRTSPEVRTHLADAAGSLVQAAAGLLATPPGDSRSTGVQKIDLDDDTDWDEEP